jgi:hypothetical protein
MVWLFGCLLALAVAWFVFKPLFEGSDVSEPEQADDRLLNLRDQKERCVQVLKDLDMDFSTGKIEKEDYETTKLQLSTQLAEIMNALEKSAER